MQDSKRDTDVKNKLLDCVGEGEGGMIWENNIETYILSYVKKMTIASLMHEASTQNWCSGTTLRDRVGGRWEGVQDGEHMCTRGWLMLMSGKNHHNIVK